MEAIINLTLSDDFPVLIDGTPELVARLVVSQHVNAVISICLFKSARYYFGIILLSLEYGKQNLALK